MSGNAVRVHESCVLVIYIYFFASECFKYETSVSSACDISHSPDTQSSVYEHPPGLVTQHLIQRYRALKS